MAFDPGKGTWTFYDTVKAFPRVPPHWDSDNVVAEFQVGLDADGGGTYGEFGITFYAFHRRERWRSDSNKVSLRIEAFGDSLAALNSIDLLERLAALDEQHQGTEDVAAVLLDMGMVDKTAELRGDHPAYCDKCRGLGVLDDVAPSDRIGPPKETV